MKKILILIPFILNAFPAFFVDKNGAYRLDGFYFMEKITKTKAVKNKISSDFYETHYVKYYEYKYKMYTKVYYSIYLICKKKINFMKITDKTDIIKEYQCKEIYN